VTHATSLPKIKPKTIFYISCDHLAPNMAIILSIHALQICKGMWAIRSAGGNSKLTSPLGGCGDYGAVDSKIVIGDFIEEMWGVKLSHEEEYNNLMKT